MTYAAMYARWQENPEAFWMEAAEAIAWDRAPTKALSDKGDGLYEWFADGMTNTCYNAVDRHVEAGRGEQVAIIYDSPVTHTKREITYMELRNLTSKNFETVEVLRRRYEGALEEILRSGVTEGAFAIADTKVATMGIIAMLTGLNTWFREDGRLSFDEVEDLYWGMVRNSVGLAG